jgi:Ca2+-binding RTX toxin-like protein
MRKPRVARPGLLALALILAVTVVTALTATNTVPATNLGRTTQPITANALKPAPCAALNLSAVVVGTGTFSGGSASELILGGSGIDTIRGGAGTDCLLGGGGNDSLRGDGGTDVCIGGPGADTFFASCETQIQ